MAEPSTEAEAESILLSAVMAPDSQDLEAGAPAKLDPPQDLDDETEGVEGAQEEGEQGETQAKTGETPTEDEVEIPGEDGQEPTRVKVTDLLESHKALQAIKGREHEVVERIEREYVAAAQQEYRQVREFSMQTGAMIQAAMQLLQAPRAPDANSMLNPSSPQYDPDGYHRAFAAYQQQSQLFGQTQQLGAGLLQQAQEAQARSEAERDHLSLQRLQAKGGWYADFARDDPKNPNGPRAQFASDMGKTYGFSFEELDAALTDPRYLEVSRDALAYRAMKAQSGDLKTKVEAKAPKLVRSKQEAKGSSAQQRDGTGKFVGETKARAMKSNSDDDWAAHFAGLVKAGRI